MTSIVIGLVISYIALAVLLLVMILYSRLHWGMKAAVVVLASVFYPVSYFSLLEILGWPTAQELPDRFRLVAAQVYEPDKQQETSGAIYVWVTDVSEKAGQVAPRAYVLTQELTNESTLKVVDSPRQVTDLWNRILEIGLACCRAWQGPERPGRLQIALTCFH